MDEIKIITQVEKTASYGRSKYTSKTFHYLYIDNKEIRKYPQGTRLTEVKKMVTKHYGEYVYSHVGSIIVDPRDV